MLVCRGIFQIYFHYAQYQRGGYEEGWGLDVDVQYAMAMAEIYIWGGGMMMMVAMNVCVP